MSTTVLSVYVPQIKVDWTSSTAFSQFILWKREVLRIINGPLAKESDSIKINHIFIWAGAHAEKLIDARTSEDPSIDIETPDDLLGQLETCLTHSTFFREAREDFYNIKQNPNENTTTYFSRIMDLYKQATFPSGTDFLIVDKLIHGCYFTETKRKLMSFEQSANIKNCLDLMRKYEAVDVTMKRLAQSNQNSFQQIDNLEHSLRNINKFKYIKSQNKTVESNKKFCVWCGNNTHPRDNCPAKDATCRYCEKKGHFEKVCLKKKKYSKQKSTVKQNLVETSDAESEYEYQSEYNIHTVNTPAREVLAKVIFHLKSNKCITIQGKVDTGAMVSCLPISMLPLLNLSKRNLTQNKVTLRGVSRKRLRNYGTISLEVTCNGHQHKSTFYVTDSGRELLLGLGFCKQFNLVEIAETCIQREIMAQPDKASQSIKSEYPENIKAVHIMDESQVNYKVLCKKWEKYLPLGKKTGNALDDLKLIFPDMFDGQVGLFKGEVNLELSQGAKPIQLAPRAIPQSVMPQLKTQLDTLESEGIIRPCPEPTEWVHNLVTVVKKDGSLRLCLDPRNLNKYLIRSVYYTASWEDVQHSLKNGLYFSTLDAKSGYWTKRLNKQSQILTAFNTPFKKYCFVRMPFGLSVSSEIFCEHMDRALAGIPGTFPCADDVKIQGSTEERHDLHLLETVLKAKQAGLKFNPDKCIVKQQRIEYFGRIITPQGIQPCPKKVRAIVKMQRPVDKQELQSLLGLVNFMSNFIPNLTQKTHMMRGLLKKGVSFVWTSDMQKELDSIKGAISTTTQLVHYDSNKPIVIETDASLKGLGAVLLQNGKPVRFLSKSLTKTEMGYANIERELLAVLFACEKLHNYTFGRSVTIHTDHKPLVNIFQKPISLAPTRLQRMLLRLAKYNIDINYVSAKNVLIADTLSRLVKPESDSEVPDLDVNIAQVLNITPTRLDSLREETKCDSTLMKLRDFIMIGWPKSMQDLPEMLHAYWCFRDELTILDGLIMKGNRVVVPNTMRSETLSRLHDAHQGLSSTLQRARRTVYWPKMQNDITDMINCCTDCQIFAKKKPKPPERQISASRPSQILGADLMNHNGQNAIVTIDFFSGYITYDQLKGQTTDQVIHVLNINFQKFGLVEEIVSDNGPCFKSDKFETFCTDMEISHGTSSPHYHQSMGRVERAIQTVKQILRKSNNQFEITLGLNTYHDTPINELLPSPAELFFNRRLNTRLGLMYRPTQLSDSVKIHLSDQRSAHLRKTNSNFEYVPNQPIWFTEDGYAEWKPGFIDSKDPRPDSYWIINQKNDRRLRRNKHDLKPRYVVHTEQQPKESFTNASQFNNEHYPDEPIVQVADSPINNTESITSQSSLNKTFRSLEKKNAESPNPPVITRSGRTIKPPTILDL